jgi:hypothetical protein
MQIDSMLRSDQNPIETHIATQNFTRRISLANKGTTVAWALASTAIERNKTPSDIILLSILAQKIADHLNLAATALESGHFFSVPILLRSALDSIGVLYYTSQNQLELKKWAFLTYSDFHAHNVDPVQLREIRTDFYTRARSSYDSLLSGGSQSQPVKDLIREFNAHVHPGVEGLLDIVDIHLELKQLLGSEVPKALEMAGGDLNKMFNLLDITNQSSKKRHKNRKKSSKYDRQKKSTKRDLSAAYPNHDILDYYTSLLHATTHHLVDIACLIFCERATREIILSLNEWQIISLRELKTYQ